MENGMFEKVKPIKFNIKQKRAKYFDVADIISTSKFKVDDEDIEFYETIDVIYRTLCAILYNFVPTSGHPGGSISSGRIVQGLIFDNMDYDFTDPQRHDNDIISYAAGHKAIRIYSLLSLRNEFIK